MKSATIISATIASATMTSATMTGARLTQCHMLQGCAPRTWIWGLWRVVSPFIQPATKDKIKFLSGQNRESTLHHYIPQHVSDHCRICLYNSATLILLPANAAGSRRKSSVSHAAQELRHYAAAAFASIQHSHVKVPSLPSHCIATTWK